MPKYSLPPLGQPVPSTFAQFQEKRLHKAAYTGAGLAILACACDYRFWPVVGLSLIGAFMAMQIWDVMTGVSSRWALLRCFAFMLAYTCSTDYTGSLYCAFDIYGLWLYRKLRSYYLLDTPFEDIESMYQENDRFSMGHFVASIILWRKELLYRYLEFSSKWKPFYIIMATIFIRICNTDASDDFRIDPAYYLRRILLLLELHLTISVNKAKRRICVFCEEMHKLMIDFDSLNEFSYEDIESDEIRLLYLDRRCVFSGLLSLRLESISREKSTRENYEALSYVWGTDQPDRPVLVNGESFYIRSNLYELLHARASIKCKRVIWVDAICINQSKDGNDEKSIQVKRMKEVYVNAKRVIGWLGHHDDAKIAVRMMNRICKAFVSWARTPEKFEGSFDRQGLGWKAFVKIASSPYFCRAWICQEASLGCELQFYIGGHYIRPGAVYHATGAVLGGEFRSKFFPKSSGDSEPFVRAVQNWHVVYYLRQAEFQEEPGPRYSPRTSISLGLLLSLCAHHEAGNPVDKIYSLLGISETSLAKSIKPDYERYGNVTHSVEVKVAMKDEFFIDTAVKLVNFNDAMYLLPHAGIGYSRKHSKLPTWVPDWEAESQRQSQILSIYNLPGLKWYGKALSSDLSEYMFRASGTSELSFTTCPDFKLQVKAIRIGTIEKLTEIYDNYNEDPAYHFRWLYEAEDQFKQVLDKTKSDKDVIWQTLFADETTSYKDAFWRTLIMDGTYDQKPCPDHWDTVYKEWRQYPGPRAQFSVDSARIAAMKVIFGDEYFRDAEYRCPGLESATFVYGSRFTDSCAGRRFCTTANNKIGLTPPAAQKDDVVCIVLGLQVPYLLRWCENRVAYELVGECYIHGVMYGKAVSKEKVEILTIA